MTERRAYDRLDAALRTLRRYHYHREGPPQPSFVEQLAALHDRSVRALNGERIEAEAVSGPAQAEEDAMRYMLALDGNREFRGQVQEYERAMAGAIRAGLLTDPHAPRELVEAACAWVETQRALGRRESLRRARSGFERGVRRPLQGNAVQEYAEVLAWARGGDWDPASQTFPKRRTKESLRRRLTRTKKLIAEMTQQGFNKRLGRFLTRRS